MSFRRRTKPSRALSAGVTDVAGTHVVSSGIRGLDGLLGGGLPLGRLAAVIEDGVGTLHAHVVGAFASQALQHGQALAVALPNVPAEDFVKSLEGQTSDVPKGTEEAPTANLSIAWRYAQRGPNVPVVKAQNVVREGMKSTPSRLSALGFPDVGIRSLLDNVRAHCERAKKEGVPCCACICSLGTLWLWEDLDLHSVLIELRSIAVKNNAALLITLPAITEVSHAALDADVVVRMTALPQAGSRAPNGVALLEKAVHVKPGIWLGRRGDAYTYRATRRGVSFEPATIEPEEGDGGDDISCSNGGAL